MIKLEPGRKYLGIFTLLNLLHCCPKGIAVLNLILNRLNYFDRIYDRKNKIVFQLRFNDLITKAILRYGNYEPYSINAALHLLKTRKGVFLDLGANFGLYSVYAGKLTEASVFAVDGLPEAFVQLTNHIEKNNLQNKITPCNVILSQQFGFTSFGMHHKGNLGSSRIVQKSDTTNKTFFIAPTATLDDLLKELGLYNRTITLVKIDLEGHEYEVLSNSKLIVNKQVDCYILEYFPHETNAQKTLELLETGGYVPYTVLGHRYKYEIHIPENNLVLVKNNDHGIISSIFSSIQHIE